MGGIKSGRRDNVPVYNTQKIVARCKLQAASKDKKIRQRKEEKHNPLLPLEKGD